VIRRKVRRSELLNFFRSLNPYLVRTEACATAHRAQPSSCGGSRLRSHRADRSPPPRRKPPNYLCFNWIGFLSRIPRTIAPLASEWQQIRPVVILAQQL
jgi:hypothetical protein